MRFSAPADGKLPVRFTASRKPGTLRELKTCASFDDGLDRVSVKALVPSGGTAGGHVSLRVVALDTDGNSVGQTVLRHYRLRA